MKEELIELAGGVIDKQPNAFFKVQINDSEHIVLASLSGRMRRNRIRILMGDRVDIELSPYDLTKGRITSRHKEDRVQRYLSRSDRANLAVGETHGKPAQNFSSRQ